MMMVAVVVVERSVVCFSSARRSAIGPRLTTHVTRGRVWAGHGRVSWST